MKKSLVKLLLFLNTLSMGRFSRSIITVSAIVLLVLLSVIFIKNGLEFVALLTYKFPQFSQRSDFTAFYNGGQMILHGVKEHLYNYQTQFYWQKQFTHSSTPAALRPFRNPPFVAAFFALYALFPFAQAYLLWLATNLVSLFLIVVLVLRSIPSQTLFVRFIIILSMLTFLPVNLTFILAQLSFFLVLALLGGRFLLIKKQPFASGLLLSLLFIKPQYLLLPFVFLLVKREYKAVIGMTTGCLLAIGVSLLFVGWGGVFNYSFYSFDVTQRGDAYSGIQAFMPTLQGFLLTMKGTTAISVIRLPWLVGTGIVLAVGAYICRQRVSFQSSQFELEWAALTITLVLTSVWSNLQDLGVLIVVLVCLLRFAESIRDTLKKLLIYLLLFAGYWLCFVSFLLRSNYPIQVYVPFLCGVLVSLALLSKAGSTKAVAKTT